MKQQAFAAAVRQAGGLAPPGLHVRAGCDPQRRFDVYRNSHFASLVAAVKESFPVCLALVGKVFFDAMARCFVATHPPPSPVLTEYTRLLPPFLDSFAPAASVPYLADVARLEQLRIETWHACDAQPLPRAALQAILSRPDLLPQVHLRLHPSLALLESRYAVFGLWAAHHGRLPIETVVPAQPQSVLVLRPRDVVEVVAVDDATAAFVRALSCDLPFGAAARAAMERDPEADLGVVLTALVRNDALAEIQLLMESCL